MFWVDLRGTADHLDHLADCERLTHLIFQTGKEVKSLGECNAWPNEMEEGRFSHAIYIFKVLFWLGFAYKESYIGNKNHRTGEKVSKSCWQSWSFIFFKKKSHRKGMLLWKDTAINCSYLLVGGLEISHWQRQSSSATTFKLNQLNHLNGEYRT